MKLLQLLWIAALITFGIAQLAASFVGLEYYIGDFWTGVLIFVAITLRLTLPLTIGAFLGAFKVWGWHWLLAFAFTVPGLLLIIPGAFTFLFTLIKRPVKGATI